MGMGIKNHIFLLLFFGNNHSTNRRESHLRDINENNKPFSEIKKRILTGKKCSVKIMTISVRVRPIFSIYFGNFVHRKGRRKNEEIDC
ncbi:MAG: hypothetical protein J6H18_02235, partial [Lachnospiraceae bacterium]|nr:hypothetical protein [Lachnospiraceae bacterium]